MCSELEAEELHGITSRGMEQSVSSLEHSAGTSDQCKQTKQNFTCYNVGRVKMVWLLKWNIRRKMFAAG